MNSPSAASPEQASGPRSGRRRRTLGVVANDGKVLAGAGIDDLRAVLTDLGVADPVVRVVPKSKHAPPAVLELVEHHGVDRLLVWGGDGTVRRCVDTLLRNGHDQVEVALLPAGTANLLAVNLGVPVDLRGAVEVAVDGRAEPVDVGIVDGVHHFVVMAGAGFDALLIEEADASGLKQRFGRWGYVWAGIRHRHARSVTARVVVDGVTWYAGPSSAIIVGNVGRLLGGLPAFPDAQPDDGVLEVGVVEVHSGVEWIRLLVSAALHRLRSSPMAHVSAGRSFVVEFERPRLWQVDGGDRSSTDRLSIECLPGAIRICRPTS